MPAELVLVAAFTFPDEAKLARGALESAGINCYLENECTLDVRWDLAQAVGGFRLMVAPSDLALARELLASRVSGEELAAQAGLELPEGDEWILFRTFGSQLDITMARAFLESEGIPCLFENENVERIGGGWTTNWAPLRLLVPASMLALARQLATGEHDRFAH